MMAPPPPVATSTTTTAAPITDESIIAQANSMVRPDDEPKEAAARRAESDFFTRVSFGDSRGTNTSSRSSAAADRFKQNSAIVGTRASQLKNVVRKFVLFFFFFFVVVVSLFFFFCLRKRDLTVCRSTLCGKHTTILGYYVQAGSMNAMDTTPTTSSSAIPRR